MHAKFLKLLIQVFYWFAYFLLSRELGNKCQNRSQKYLRPSFKFYQSYWVLSLMWNRGEVPCKPLKISRMRAGLYVNGTAGVNTVKETRTGKPITVHNRDSTGQDGTQHSTKYQPQQSSLCNQPRATGPCWFKEDYPVHLATDCNRFEDLFMCSYPF